MNENVRRIIGWWKLKGERESDPFVRFFFFWVCLDAWLTAESKKDSDKEKIQWFINNENYLKEKWEEVLASSTIAWLNELKNLSPITDMRPNRRREVSLNDIRDPAHVIKFVYQIRCNFFHGSKDPTNNRDKNLVELAGYVLEKWIV